MVALNRVEEFRMYIRAACNIGVTRDEIKEVLLQSAIYCGAPAANSAFRMAAEVFDDMDKKTKAKSKKRKRTYFCADFNTHPDRDRWRRTRRSCPFASFAFAGN